VLSVIISIVIEVKNLLNKKLHSPMAKFVGDISRLKPEEFSRSLIALNYRENKQRSVTNMNLYVTLCVEQHPPIPVHGEFHGIRGWPRPPREEPNCTHPGNSPRAADSLID
jgi:hypothetical protein